MTDFYGLRKLVLGYQGLFDFDGFYHTMVDFYESRHYDFNEDLYKDKEGSPVGHEVNLKISPDKKVSEYVRYYHKIVWDNWDTHEVEVVRDGKTVTLTFSRFRFEVKGWVKVDWQNFEKQHTKMGSFFKKHVIKREITEIHEPTLMFETQELIDTLKRFLQLEVTRTEKVS